MVPVGGGDSAGKITIDATLRGTSPLLESAESYPLPVRAIEGTGGHGAGLTRRLVQGQELVAELDRPERAHRRNGAKSDPFDAIRAAREALARLKVGTRAHPVTARLSLSYWPPGGPRSTPATTTPG
ncbi:hypothetical protein AB3X52_17770 [Nocardioides sp. DS6]|uniref:Transposase IS111A/IS1328/IS1533 N-terminal domain-containing protein n=1 Tax=Nocardioides eburneus TaxID=3231482 RepID=A0ABV3T453_9ACTN